MNWHLHAFALPYIWSLTLERVCHELIDLIVFQLNERKKLKFKCGRQSGSFHMELPILPNVNWTSC